LRRIQRAPALLDKVVWRKVQAQAQTFSLTKSMKFFHNVRDRKVSTFARLKQPGTLRVFTFSDPTATMVQRMTSRLFSLTRKPPTNIVA
jgi:hypothetical protein